MQVRAYGPDGCRYMLSIVLREDGTVLVNGCIAGTKDKLFARLGWKREPIERVVRQLAEGRYT